jgi:pyrimidine-specific ribonucleoside hydrolase
MNIILNSSSARNEGVAFYEFPFHPNNYTKDIRVIMEKAIEKFGYEEWRSIVLTCELHGHLGIYSIIGVKMGMFAMYTLQSGHGDLSIVSYAGSNPPISCLNDGLQLSTGATLGHGLITIREANTGIPVVDFTNEGKTVRITLIDVIYQKIEESLKVAFKESGGMTDKYWKRIRKLAIVCWVEFDRNKIFNIEEIIK